MAPFHRILAAVLATPLLVFPVLSQPSPEAAALVAGVVEPALAQRCLPELALPAAGPLPGGGIISSTPMARRAPAARVIIAVDASGSMAGRAGGETKMAAAIGAARRFLEGLGPEVEVGLLVFGHRGNARNEGRAASCRSAEALVPLGLTGRAAALDALGRIRPVGWTPLAAAMEAAAAAFRPSEREGEQLLLVISDGVETCGGDPIAVARRLNTGPLRVAVDIVGFDVATHERAALQAVARAGGGDFANVSSAEAAREALRRSREATLSEMGAARARTGAAVQTGHTVNRANVGIARAQSCVSLALAREQTALNQLDGRIRARLSGREGAASVDPAALAGARTLLAAPHAAIRASLDEYAAAVGTARDAQINDIGRRLLEALLSRPG